MPNVERIFDILIDIAGGLFAAGVVLLVVDAVTGFRFIERFRKVGETLGTVNKGVWILIAVIVVATIIVRGLAAPSHDPNCHVFQERDGQEVVC